MKVIFAICALFIIAAIGCEGNLSFENRRPIKPFMGLVLSDTPKVLEPGFISTELVEYNGTFSPDGTEFFYTVQAARKGHIAHTRLDDHGEWTTPVLAPFASGYSEYDPLFTPDGSRLYFSSQRPISQTAEAGTTHIWYVERNPDGWGEPQLVELTDQGDYYSSVTVNGDIYFNIWATGKIMKAAKTDTGYLINALPEAINSRSDVGDPFISPAGDYLIYRAYYDEGFGQGDLYVSFLKDEKWTHPQNLGEPINSSSHEMCPYVTTDGAMFIYASNRMQLNYTDETLDEVHSKDRSFDNGRQNIYYTSTTFIDSLRSTATHQPMISSQRNQ